MKKDAILQKLKTEKVIALIRADNPDGLLDCAKALAAGGLTSIELTMTTPGAIRVLEKVIAEMPDFLFGLGTVLDAETARIGILSGATFIVTPAFRPDVIAVCQRYSVHLQRCLHPHGNPRHVGGRRRRREGFPRRIFRPRLHQGREGPFPADRTGPHRRRE